METLKGLLSKLDVYRPIPNEVSAQIDSMRGLAAIVVLLAHCNQIFISPTYHGLYAIFGVIAQSAVMVFFVLSGFLIGKSLTRNASSASGFSLSRYAVDRANRIFPPLLFATAILLALFFLAPYTFSTGSNSFIRASEFMARPGLDLDAMSIAGSLLFLNGLFTLNIPANAPLWSLSFEVWYYVAAGFIFFYQGAKRVIVFAAIMCTLGALNKFFILYSAVWFSGLAICVLHNNNIFNKKVCTIVLAAFGLPAFALAAYYVGTFYGYTAPSQINMKVIVLYNFFFGIATAALFFMLVNGLIKIRPILRGSAEFSYTLYVIHFPILLFIYGTTQTWTLGSVANSCVVAVGSAALCVALASVAARSVEKARPFGALKAATA